MSVAYKWVQWNRQKIWYDAIAAGGVVLFVSVFMALGIATAEPGHRVSEPILLMRALGAGALVLLHVILLIGPWSRFTDRVAPLLYNRRHLGVLFFAVCVAHAAVALLFYGGFGETDPVSALLLSPSADVASLDAFPFEWLGFLALLIFFVMGATSHDFWLKNLSPRVWKRLHMLVYVAYALVIGHVALGSLQSEPDPVVAWLLRVGVLLVVGSHVLAALVTRARLRARVAGADGWVEVGPPEMITPDRATIVALGDGSSVAVFREGSRFSAISNVCAHQGGPLGEGKIVDGCVTCPWHGYQYRAEDGCSPPPYTERIATYELRLEGGVLRVNPRAKAPGTRVEPVRVEGLDGEPSDG
ncbi:MAG: Rieske 2Fe-2S domain-containing protein [Phycisphaerales bacterium JB037]